MFKYIKSEIFRLFKTPSFKYFIIFSMGSMVVLSAIWGINKVEMDYLAAMEDLAFIAMWVLSIICLVIAYKTKDTGIQILSYGISREKMFLFDFISFILMVLITTIILALIAIATVWITVTLKIAHSNMEFSAFLKNVAWMYFMLLNMNMAIFGSTYFLNNVASGFAVHILGLPLLFNYLAIFFKNRRIFGIIAAFQDILPYSVLRRYINYKILSFEDYKTILISFLVCAILNMGSGLLKFKKREIY